MRWPGLAAIVVSLGILGFPAPARAESADDEVSQLIGDAMFTDYANNDYAAARVKLRRALKKCGKHRCSTEVRGKVYRDLGVVYWFLDKKTLARRAFERAVEIDPSGHLDSDFATPQVSALFRDAGGSVDEAESEGSSDSESSASDEDSETTESEGKRRKDGRAHSWLSLSAQQDWLLYGATHPVCGNSQYECFAGGTQYRGPIWPDYGNRVSGGLALATTRVLVGFEQVLGSHFALGVRVGVAFRGGPALGGDKFVPAHAELRMAYYFGKDPFAGSGVRPYLALGGGFAEVRSRLDVDFYPDAASYNQAKKQTVSAWHPTGRGFVAPTVGAQFAFTRTFALTLELRWMEMFPVRASAPAASIGFAQGF